VAILGLPEDKNRTQHLAASLNGAASRLHFYETDVANYDRCREAVEEVLRRHGRIDMLVNNAGITRDHTVRKMTVDEWEAVLQVNLSGPFFMIKAVLDSMVERGYGRIVNISSVVGVSGNFGQANYAAAKGGLIAWTKTLALELARHGVTANCVCPGFTDTDMLASVPEEIRERLLARVPLGRFATPEEVAQAVVFVAAEADYMTGSCLDLNGGLYM
jgi:NAD(P)-dependent dehydrogenase (short-subunit alcohol dehydrogenase family)